MSGASSIEWTDATWNPVRGCVKVSPGCKHCYAETFAERFRGVPGHPYEQGFDPRLVATSLDAPLHWKKPRKIFVNSMSDMFGEFVPDEYIDKVVSLECLLLRHTFQNLTQRASRMAKYFAQKDLYNRILDAAHQWRRNRPELFYVGISDPRLYLPKHVHLGVSVEDRKYGLPRIEHLRQTPATVRFLSIEPLLEDLGTLDLTGIHWVIVGGESGHGARPMHPDWARSIRDQCVAAGVPFFFKQWGEWRGYSPITSEFYEATPYKMNGAEVHLWGEPDGKTPLPISLRIGKKNAGRVLDGRTWDEVPK
jgi:protein gp37